MNTEPRLTFTDLRLANIQRQKEWDGDAEFNELFFADALAGEVGEAAEVVMMLALQVALTRSAGKVANIAKKLERARLGLPGSVQSIQDMKNELADVVTYADLLANKLNVSLAECLVDKFNYVSTKYNMKTRLTWPDVLARREAHSQTAIRYDSFS